MLATLALHLTALKALLGILLCRARGWALGFWVLLTKNPSRILKAQTVHALSYSV